MELNRTYDVSDSDIINLPIDYKSLNEADFNTGLETTKEIFDVPEGKYLTEIVIDKINPGECNTVVINSSVGQGKSTLAIEIAKRYYKRIDQKTKRYKYTVIFAVPYKSLIKQYKEKLIEEINKGERSKIITYIPDYNNLTWKENKDTENTILNNPDGASSRRMHVVTTNFLLGNPGDSTEQGYLKREYLNLLINKNKAENENRKIVIIFDEIHDCIHNFKQDLIYSLWRFKTNDILHKTFILSATLNEASKVVIKYIAELTDKKLQIIETKREQIESNLSDLHLYITPRMRYRFDEQEEFIELFEQIIKEHSIVNILSYSKTLATDLLRNNSTIKKLLVNRYGSANLCIAKEHLDRLTKEDFEHVSFNEYYLPDRCNVGTTFKTGISIEKENSALIFILPNKYAMLGFVGSTDYGILSQGIISIIQALARIREDSNKRAKSDIYVIMPTPNGLINLRNISYNSYLSHLLEFEIIKDLGIKIDLAYNYKDFEQKLQKKLICKRYNDMYQNLKKEIGTVRDLNESGQRENLPELNYPTEDLFILKKGERHLSSTFAIFGRDFPAYILWAAFNNQFVNCKIKTLSSSRAKKIEIESGKIQDTLYILFEEYFGIVDCQLSNTPDYEVYDNFNKVIFQNEIIYNEKKIYPSDYLFQQHILAFIQKFIKGNARLNNKYNIGNPSDVNAHFPDIPFELSDVIMCCISNANLYVNEIPVENSSVELIRAYKDLGEIYSIFCSDRIIKTNRKGKDYIFQSITDYENEPFTPEEKALFIDSIKEIKNSYFIDKFFKGFQTVDLDNPNKDEIIKQVYNYFKRFFFKITKNGKGSNSRNIHYIDKIIELPSKRTGINLLYSFNLTFADGFEDVFEDILIDNYNDYKKVILHAQEIIDNDAQDITPYINIEE